MRFTWAASLVLPVLLVACGNPQARDATAGSEPPGPAAGILEVICRADGDTEIVSERVQAEPDGVHVRFDNRAGEPATLSGTALDFSEGVTEQVAPMAPGRHKVACWPHSKHGGPEPKLLAIEVLDPENRWRAGELECTKSELVSSVQMDYVADAEGKVGDPEEITRKTANGIGPGDEVLTVGYPDAENRKIGVRRNGKLVAVFSYWPALKGGWLVGDYSTCESSGISA